MILDYQTFYRKFGVRQTPHLLNPILSDAKFLNPPMESVYQFVCYDGSMVGPSSDDVFFRNIKRPIPVATELKLTSVEGAPRPMGGSFNQMIVDYYRQQRRMRQLKSLAAYARDKQTVLVYNYAMLSKMYRYPQSLMSHYYQWKNIFATMLNSIAHTSKEINHHHFIFTKIPLVLPSMQQLTMAAEEMNQTSLKNFRDPESLLLLELWKWFAGEPGSSLFKLIPNNKIHLVNIVLEESGKWLVFNLGVLHSFFDDKEAAAYEKEKKKKAAEVDQTTIITPTDTSGVDEKEYVIKSKHGLDGLQLAKRILRMYMTVMEVRTVTTNSEITEEQAPVHDQTDTPDGVVIDPEDPNQTGISATDDDDDDEDVSQTHMSTDPGYDEPYREKVADAIYINTGLPDIHVEVDDLTVDEFKKMIQGEDEIIDADLKKLEEIAAHAEAQSENTHVLHLLQPQEDQPLENGVTAHCAKLAKDGLLSAAEVRRFEKLASSYKSFKAPYSDQPFPEFLKISQEMLRLGKPSELPPSSGVVDKKMQYSTLVDFTPKYVSNVLHRDYANTVMALQKAAVAVTSYKVEKKHDILGGYEEHILRLSPVEGEPSTIRIKVPVVDPDGSFTANGVRYTLRLQRGSIPIHKSGPNRVALTSYYGKTFVTRGRKNSDDYGHWLKNQLYSRALDRNNTDLYDPVIEQVYDPEYKCPRAYSAAAMALKSVKTPEFQLCFDHKEIEATYNPAVLASINKHGMTVFGKSLAGEVYLGMDKNNSVYKVAEKQVTPVGTLEDFLGLDLSSAPVEYATAGVFGKDIPIGVMLGLLMGLENLLKALQVKYRRVPVGQRTGMTKDEYSLVFSDEVLIFDRKDKLASLILGGFKEYERSLRLFSVYSFDKSGVYVNLLESNKISTHYVREIELANKLFIDPITRDILIERKEPTTYVGLLFKAAQLLCDDTHPGELSPEYMRFKGYERISGAIYAELIKAYREHNSSLNKSHSSIRMNPYAVWRRISEDPAKVQSSQINPISSLKETEAVTFGGTGGRSSVSMTKHTRGFHEGDQGTISEATKDSGDVGINTYLSANPNLTSLRGLTKRFDMKNPDATTMLSTSALLAPFSDRDD